MRVLTICVFGAFPVFMLFSQVIDVTTNNELAGLLFGCTSILLANMKDT